MYDARQKIYADLQLDLRTQIDLDSVTKFWSIEAYNKIAAECNVSWT